MYITKELLLNDSIVNYVQSFNTPKDLLDDFVQYDNIPLSKGLAILNCVLYTVHLKFFSRINRISVHEPQWIDNVMVKDARIELVTDKGYYELFDRSLCKDSKEVYKLNVQRVIHDCYGYKYHDEEGIKSKAINNIAYLLKELV